MRVYEVLREELLADDLIAGQPSFSAEYMKKVILLGTSSPHPEPVSLSVHM